MAGDEHQAQQVVADVVVERGLARFVQFVVQAFELVGDLRMLARQQLLAAQVVDRAVLGGGISQAPGLSGTPLAGQRSSAVTSASCASSSARSRSRTMRRIAIW